MIVNQKKLRKSFRFSEDTCNKLSELVEKENALNTKVGYKGFSENSYIESLILDAYNRRINSDIIAEAKSNEREYVTDILDNLFKIYFGKLASMLEENTDIVSYLIAATGTVEKDRIDPNKEKITQTNYINDSYLHESIARCNEIKKGNK